MYGATCVVRATTQGYRFEARLSSRIYRDPLVQSITRWMWPMDGGCDIYDLIRDRIDVPPWWVAYQTGAAW